MRHTKYLELYVCRIPEISNNYGAPLVLVVGVALLDNDVWSARVSCFCYSRYTLLSLSLSLSLSKRDTHHRERDTPTTYICIIHATYLDKSIHKYMHKYIYRKRFMGTGVDKRELRSSSDFSEIMSSGKPSEKDVCP